ncbi:Pentatricopeptide repeat-containing protein, partial [Drosera capensis]
MNHRVVDLLDDFIQDHPEEDGQEHLILRALEEIPAGRKVRAIVYSMLVKCYVDRDMTTAAVTVVWQMERLGIFPSKGVCNLLVRSLLRSIQEDLVWDLLDLLWSQGMLDASLINPLVSFYCSKDGLHCGWKLLMDMRKFGVKPDVVADAIVIQSLCKESCLKGATSVVFKMIQIGVHPDSVLLGASNIFLEMSESGLHPDCFIYSTIINGYCKHYSQSGAMTMAEHVFCDMTDEGLVTDIVVYNILMNGYRKREGFAQGVSGDFQEAFDLWYTMSKYDTSPDVVTCSALLSGYCRACLMDEASAMFDRVLNACLIPDLILYNTMIRGFCRIGNITHACGLIRMMIEKNLMPNEVTYRALVLGYEKKMVDNASGAALSKLQRVLAEQWVRQLTHWKHGSFEQASMHKLMKLMERVLLQNVKVFNRVGARNISITLQRVGILAVALESRYDWQQHHVRLTLSTACKLMNFSLLSIQEMVSSRIICEPDRLQMLPKVPICKRSRKALCGYRMQIMGVCRDDWILKLWGVPCSESAKSPPQQQSSKRRASEKLSNKLFIDSNR